MGQNSLRERKKKKENSDLQQVDVGMGFLADLDHLNLLKGSRGDEAFVVCIDFTQELQFGGWKPRSIKYRNILWGLVFIALLAVRNIHEKWGQKGLQDKLH